MLLQENTYDTFTCNHVITKRLRKEFYKGKYDTEKLGVYNYINSRTSEVRVS